MCVLFLGFVLFIFKRFVGKCFQFESCSYQGFQFVDQNRKSRDNLNFFFKTGFDLENSLIFVRSFTNSEQ